MDSEVDNTALEFSVGARDNLHWHKDHDVQRPLLTSGLQYPIWFLPQQSIHPSLQPYWLQSCSPDSVDFRFKTQTKDNTGSLKLWLVQHRKHPYPSKPEKIMLAILSRMTLTQVSTWFANARRRLKKDYPHVHEMNPNGMNGCHSDNMHRFTDDPIVMSEY